VQQHTSKKQQTWVEMWNLNGICDKVTFKEISTPSSLNEKVLSRSGRKKAIWLLLDKLYRGRKIERHVRVFTIYKGNRRNYPQHA